MKRILSVLIVAAGLMLPSAATAQPAPDPAAQRTTPAAQWHFKHFHMNAYRRTGTVSHLSGSCSGSWHDDSGSCWGYGEQLGDFTGKSYPFSGAVIWKWHRHSTACPDVPGGRDTSVWKHEVHLEAAHLGTGQNSTLCGWVDHGWNRMLVTGGTIVDPQGIKRPVHPTGGRAEDTEKEGGPLFVFLKAQDQGYVLGLRGWLKY